MHLSLLQLHMYNLHPFMVGSVGDVNAFNPVKQMCK